MTLDSLSAMQRRDFLKLAGATTVCSLSRTAHAASSQRITVVLDSGSSWATSAPVMWAAEKLRAALSAKGAACEIVKSLDEVSGSAMCIIAADSSSSVAKGFRPTNTTPASPESIRMVPGKIAQCPAILLSAMDQRGFVYGMLEFAERVQYSPDTAIALHLSQTIHEAPANEVRCVSRYFCSEIEDKPWYYDKDFWRGYLDVIAASRFNRFTMAYGLEYDFPRGVTDDYLHFPYPYLVEVPGYSQVRVMRLATPEGKRLATPIALTAEERNKNMEMLRFIASETGARGLQFQLGIWTHAYEWTASPDAYHHIDGLTPETHAPYCRDALAILLKQCPEIQGLTMRVHGESGIPEGSYPFWKTLFEAITDCGRTIEIDMHAKGVNQTMIDIASATGMPSKLGAKYSAEHQSLGYNQADIRALEIPDPNHKETGPFTLSGGSRLFTRYGYGDFFQAGSRTQVLFRLWPGSQRHLLSADPELAAAYARTSHFCGAAGLDLMEPLTFKGREGSGHAGGRCAYADESLNPQADWKKYEYYYRLWGRHLYNPDVDPEVWRRYLRSDFGMGAQSVETALANASRLLPLVTSAHLASASNHAFWPEIYDNMPIVIGSERSPYGDTPDPKCFGTVSPLDPQMFSTIVEFAKDLLDGHSNPKYSPVEVAQWLEDYAEASSQALTAARAKVKSRSAAEFRRIEEDVLIQNALGRFFAAKLRSGVLFEIYQQSGNPEAGKMALAQYKKARDFWAKMAVRAKAVYISDVSYGDVPQRRGHWSDRLKGIDKDVAAMEEKIQSPPASPGSAPNAQRAIQSATGRPRRPSIAGIHRSPASFTPGQPLSLSLAVAASNDQPAPASVHLYYRHVNQAERWLSLEMQHGDGSYTSAIPGEYTQSPFPLQYYFVLSQAGGSACFCPAFNATLSNQPYYAVTQRTA